MSLVSLGRFPVRFKPDYLAGDPFSEFKVGTVEVWVDPANLAASLGPRAMRSKGREAREASGLVVVKQVAEEARP